MRIKRFILPAAVLATFAAIAAGVDGYNRTTIPDQNTCLFWSSRQFAYASDEVGSAQTDPPESAFAAIDASFRSWQALSDTCSDLQFTALPREKNAQVGYNRTRPTENRNVITFREEACAEAVPSGDACIDEGTCGNEYRCWNHGEGTIAVTIFTFNNTTGAILDADFELNAAFDHGGFLFTTLDADAPDCDKNARVPGKCIFTDIQNTLTHEIGHAMGLNHVVQPNSTMEASAELGEIDKRIIDEGTAKGFCDIYPKGAPARSCNESTSPLDSYLEIESTGSPGCAAAGGGLWGLAPAAAAALWLVGRRRSCHKR